VSGRARASLSTILPPAATACELEAPQDGGTGAEHLLFAGERDVIAGAVESRKREFADGRLCARRALAQIGLPPSAIPTAADGSPVWPPGVVGSITHKGRYRAAAVGWAADLPGLGIDAELNDRLPTGVLGIIAETAELEQVERLLAARPEVRWDRLLFSAKEAVMKALQPLSREHPGLRESTVRFDAASDSFTATMRSDATAPGSAVPLVTGRWLVRPEMLIVAAEVLGARSTSPQWTDV
jgi:4'-phosphopantetheinyl transferase EntD